MKKIKHQIFILLLFINLSSLNLYPYILDWDNTDGGWNSGDLSRNYKNVNESGVDINVSITGDTDKFQNNAPSADTDSLKYDVDYDNNTQEINTTIIFSKPVILKGIRFRGIDSTNQSFPISLLTGSDDKVIIEAKDINGNSVLPTNVTKGTHVDETDTNKAYESDGSGELSETDPAGFLTFDLENVVEFKFTYTSGDDAGIAPDEQTIWLDNLKYYSDLDGDGVYDQDDIDDDNDGILDSVEIQGGGGCPYGFFHIINGVLYIFDVVNGKYLYIGEQHGTSNYINAIALDTRNGKIYGSWRDSSGQDDYGNSLLKNDIIEIDRYSGKIKKVNTTATINSFSADIYSDKYYFRNANNKAYSWTIETDSINQEINADITVADFAITDKSGDIVGYGMERNKNDNNTYLYIINFSTSTASTKNINISSPDTGTLARLYGAAFFAKNGGEIELYLANNNGYIYQIKDFDKDNPQAIFRYKSIKTQRNDGASCRDANQYPVDSDGDGIPDYHDLDSDNDGIPDNVEAQSTSGYTAPSGNDADGDGLDDAYDENTSGVPASYGLIPPDTDGDHYADFVDNDSDNDGYSDCEEGYIDASNDPSNYCPVDNSDVGNNGLVSWAENSDDYSDVNGKIDDPENDLYNETGDTTEVGYREFLCGKSNFKITAYHWRLISPPCNTGDISLKDLFSRILGEYGDDNNWVMYAQKGDDNYEVNSTHDNTYKRLMSSDDTLEVGKSYWIIADNDHILNIDKSLTGLSPTDTQDSSSVGIDDNNFTKIKEINLPANSDIFPKKYMTGNVFPYRFDISDLYFSHNNSSYTYIGDTNNSYINSVIYTHDSPKISDTDGYTAFDPTTPGFQGEIKPMEGFFIKLKISPSIQTNHLAFPLEMQNAN